jgi:hypothetical protein
VPVHKFRSIDDMPELAWRRPGDPELFRALAGLAEASRRMSPRRFPAGVYKHRSMEEMNRQRDRWGADHIASIVQARQGQA